MTVLTDRLPFPNSKKTFLVEQTAGEQLNLWTLAAGQTYTYWCATVLHVDDVKENGESLSPQTSIGDVESNAASYFWDQAAGQVYVHATGGVNPMTLTLQAIVSFCFSTEGRVYNGRYYDPRISSFPSLSMRVERVFGDPGQLGSGAMVYLNNDGFFDSLSGLQWDAGRIVLKMGIDNPSPPHAQATYAEFDTVGTWIVKEWSKSDSEFTVHFEEVKSALKVKIPIDHFTRDEFPYMREEDVGKVKPIPYGQIFDVSPICVHLGEKRFRVAGCAIQGFFGLRIKSAVSGYWATATFTTIDNSIAEFTVDSWDMKAEIAVDFFGKTKIDGVTLMDNPADVVTDILVAYLQYPDSELETTSFAASAVALAGQSALSLYLSEEIDAFDVFSQINAAVGSYLFNDHLGLFRYVVYAPPTGASVDQFTEDDIFSFSEDVDSKDIISRVKAKYQHRVSQDYWQVRFAERASSQYLQGATVPILKELELPFVKTSDGLSVAQRTVLHGGIPQRTYKTRISAKGWKILPSDFRQFMYARHGINGIFEVIETKRDLKAGMVDLVIGGLRGVVSGGSSGGFGYPGHWTDEGGGGSLSRPATAQTIPDRQAFTDVSNSIDGDTETFAYALANSSSTYGLLVYGFAAWTEPDPPVISVDLSAVLSTQGNSSLCWWKIRWKLDVGGGPSHDVIYGVDDLSRSVVQITLPDGTDLTDVLVYIEARGVGSETSEVNVYDVYTQSGAISTLVFPASLGGGSAEFWDPDWTAEQKAYAKQNFGYWCDESGFADPTDPESYLASTWI